MPRGIYKRNKLGKPFTVTSSDPVKNAKFVLVQRAIECMQDGLGTFSPDDMDESFWCKIRDYASQIIQLTEIE